MNGNESDMFMAIVRLVGVTALVIALALFVMRYGYRVITYLWTMGNQWCSACQTDDKDMKLMWLPLLVTVSLSLLSILLKSLDCFILQCISVGIATVIVLLCAGLSRGKFKTSWDTSKIFHLFFFLSLSGTIFCWWLVCHSKRTETIYRNRVEPLVHDAARNYRVHEDERGQRLEVTLNGARFISAGDGQPGPFGVGRMPSVKGVLREADAFADRYSAGIIAALRSRIGLFREKSDGSAEMSWAVISGDGVCAANEANVISVDAQRLRALSENLTLDSAAPLEWLLLGGDLIVPTVQSHSATPDKTASTSTEKTNQINRYEITQNFEKILQKLIPSYGVRSMTGDEVKQIRYFCRSIYLEAFMCQIELQPERPSDGKTVRCKTCNADINMCDGCCEVDTSHGDSTAKPSSADTPYCLMRMCHRRPASSSKSNPGSYDEPPLSWDQLLRQAEVRLRACIKLQTTTKSKIPLPDQGHDQQECKACCACELAENIDKPAPGSQEAYNTARSLLNQVVEQALVGTVKAEQRGPFFLYGSWRYLDMVFWSMFGVLTHALIMLSRALNPKGVNRRWEPNETWRVIARLWYAPILACIFYWLATATNLVESPTDALVGNSFGTVIFGFLVGLYPDTVYRMMRSMLDKFLQAGAPGSAGMAEPSVPGQSSVVVPDSAEANKGPRGLSVIAGKTSLDVLKETAQQRSLAIIKVADSDRPGKTASVSETDP